MSQYPILEQWYSTEEVQSVPHINQVHTWDPANMHYLSMLGMEVNAKSSRGHHEGKMVFVQLPVSVMCGDWLSFSMDDYAAKLLQPGDVGLVGVAMASTPDTATAPLDIPKEAALSAASQHNQNFNTKNSGPPFNGNYDLADPKLHFDHNHHLFNLECDPLPGTFFGWVQVRGKGAAKVDGSVAAANTPLFADPAVAGVPIAGGAAADLISGALSLEGQQTASVNIATPNNLAPYGAGYAEVMLSNPRIGF